MNQIKLGIALVLVIVMAVLVFQNRDPVQTKLLFATLTMPHAILLFLTAAVGFVIGSLFTVWIATRRSPRRLP
jgi:uncharacterized integral membrane protein